MVVIGVSGFYKVIILEIGVMESTIVDERHFTTFEEAKHFQMKIVSEMDSKICIVCRM